MKRTLSLLTFTWILWMRASNPEWEQITWTPIRETQEQQTCLDETITSTKAASKILTSPTRRTLYSIPPLSDTNVLFIYRNDKLETVIAYVCSEAKLDPRLGTISPPKSQHPWVGPRQYSTTD